MKGNKKFVNIIISVIVAVIVFSGVIFFCIENDGEEINKKSLANTDKSGKILKSTGEDSIEKESVSSTENETTSIEVETTTELLTTKPPITEVQTTASPTTTPPTTEVPSTTIHQTTSVITTTQPQTEESTTTQKPTESQTSQVNNNQSESMVVITELSNADTEAYINEVIRLVNVERNKVGLSLLTRNEDLCNMALIRATETVELFSHTRPDGTDCFTVFDEYGFILNGYAGENLAKGHRSPQEVVQGWMNSEGHRENILSSNFKEIGIGIVKINGVIYWSQLFYGVVE